MATRSRDELAAVGKEFGGRVARLDGAILTGVHLGGAAIERVLVNAARNPPAELDGGHEP